MNSLKPLFTLFTTTRRYLRQWISPNYLDRDLDRFLLLNIFVWFLQRQGYFHANSNYLTDKFLNILTKSPLEANPRTSREFVLFYQSLLEWIFSHPNSKDSYEEFTAFPQFDFFFLETNRGNAWNWHLIQHLPDIGFFLQQSLSINEEIEKSPLPIFNLFITVEKMGITLKEYEIGALFENILAIEEKNETGAYYTPQKICEYISNTILMHSYSSYFQQPENKLDFIPDHVRDPEILLEEHIQGILQSLNPQITRREIHRLYTFLSSLRILDPAMGSGHFLITISNRIINILKLLWSYAKKERLEGILLLPPQHLNTFPREKVPIDLISLPSFEIAAYYWKSKLIFPYMIYGIDINPDAVTICKLRYLMHLLPLNPPEKLRQYPISAKILNLFEGNALLGTIDERNLQFFFHHQTKTHLNSQRVKILRNCYQQIILLMSQISPSVIEISRSFQSVKDSSQNRDNSNFYHLITQIIYFFSTYTSLEQTQLLWSFLRQIRLNKVLVYSDLAANIWIQIEEIIKKTLQEIVDFIYFSISNQIPLTKFMESTPTKSTPLSFHWWIEFPEIFPFNMLIYQNLPSYDSLTRGFDIIIGNPPYGNLLTEFERRILKNEYSTLEEISAMFLERSMKLHKKRGNLTFITSYAITFSKDLSLTRYYINQGYAQCRIATFDRDRCRFFEGVTQSVSIVQCLLHASYSHQFGFYTTQMFRIMPNLTEIEYYSADKFLLGDQIGSSIESSHRLPKLGNRTIYDLVSKLQAHRNRFDGRKIRSLGDILGQFSIIDSKEEYDKKKKEFAKLRQEWICVRISGNYWYNAWEAPPYFGTQIVLVPLINYLSDADQTDDNEISNQIKSFLLLLINSSLYYLWFRIYSDGRHMNSDILRAFPLPYDFNTKIRQYGKLFIQISKILMDALQSVYDATHRRFLTSQIKLVIDGCDVLLGEFYDLSVQQITFIHEFEAEIRGGKQLQEGIYSNIRQYLLHIPVKIEIGQEFQPVSEIRNIFLEMVKKCRSS